jgi:hypothetical protein
LNEAKLLKHNQAVPIIQGSVLCGEKAYSWLVAPQSLRDGNVLMSVLYVLQVMGTPRLDINDISEVLQLHFAAEPTHPRKYGILAPSVDASSQLRFRVM